MTYTLILGDRTYSSWSLRGWLLFEKFGIPADTKFVDFSSRDVADQLSKYAPARTVPTVVTPEGAIVSDTLAIAEELATRHPKAGLWPGDPKLRATARAATAEMHSSFGALRSECPMHLGQAYVNAPVSEGVSDDLRRLETIWAHARELSYGPWLFGDYSVADAFFAPVAARIAGYGLEVNEFAADYVARHLADTAFRQWRAMGLVGDTALPWYVKSYRTTTWPGPKPLRGKAIETGEPENTACPYSGQPVTHLAEIEGRIFGFCNAFCRDKTVADAEAFPAFMDVYRS
ncbi:glutathione S-transferase [Litoreibacter roseus]|uniref:Glutathione S-transferase n=1 Tax=Litoreibacter roseus TaxID=2601869 RepID=A0A6N6JD66_9RHOB|nr:glutathione S-transferase [Litoreibacter roseus]GFE63319.1 glutathione S-transferase [Litoreibacter roseus]